MPTPLKSPDPIVQGLYQLMNVAGVITAFPRTTLSGVTPGRLKAALAIAPSNRHIVNEDGDLMAVVFAAGPTYVVLTPKGQARLEKEAAKAPGF